MLKSAIQLLFSLRRTCTAVSFHGHRLESRLCLQVYEQMQEQGLDPTATTYTALVSAHCKSDNLDAALEVQPACPLTDVTLLSEPCQPSTKQ